MITSLLAMSILLLNSAPPETSTLEQSKCHIYVDYDFICTFEIVGSGGQNPTPILNLIAFSVGEWEIEPNDIHLIGAGNEEFKVVEFSFDTGDPDKPYRASYLKLRGGDFTGLDLLGKFEDLEVLSRVELDLGKSKVVLDPVECGEFERLLERISEIDLNTRDLIGTYESLGMTLYGSRTEK